MPSKITKIPVSVSPKGVNVQLIGAGLALDGTNTLSVDPPFVTEIVQSDFTLPFLLMGA